MPGPLMRGIGRMCLNSVEMQRYLWFLHASLYLQTDSWPSSRSHARWKCSYEVGDRDAKLKKSSQNSLMRPRNPGSKEKNGAPWEGSSEYLIWKRRNDHQLI